MLSLREISDHFLNCLDMLRATLLTGAAAFLITLAGALTTFSQEKASPALIAGEIITKR